MEKQQIPRLGKNDYRYLFKRFHKELIQWMATGKEPEIGNQDMKYYLDLQEHRMKEHSLSMEMAMEPITEPVSAHELCNNFTLYDTSSVARFNQSSYFQQTHQSINFIRDGKTVYNEELASTFYQTILYPDWTDSKVSGTPYTCPNCGAVTKLGVLQEKGCPYCGTHFLMQDLYPKVSNYYFIDFGAMTQKGMKKILRKAAKVLGWIVLTYAVFTAFSLEKFSFASFFFLLFSSLITGISVGVVIYFIISLLLLCRLFIKSGKNINVQVGTSSSKRRITEEMKPLDPSFDYEYFESKALALTRILMLSEDPDQCVQYSGPKLGNCFHDVVDIRYRGGFKLIGVEKTKDKIEVILKLYLKNTLDNGKKVRAKDQKVTLRMFHKTQFPVDKAFSIVQVECPFCAGSFDARKSRNCPHCGNPYDSGIHDWIVTEISR